MLCLQATRLLFINLLFLLIFSTYPIIIKAETISGDRHDSLHLPELLEIETGFTATTQSSNESRINNESFISFDLLTTIPAGSDHWAIYLEGNSSPQNNGISSILGESNADAGTALDQNSKGRFQISEIQFSRSTRSYELNIGMLDICHYFDVSDFANDPSTQFISSSLVNNPSIEFPDYTLGTVYTYKNKPVGISVTFALTSSHGLGDNPDASYSELMDIRATGKGIFSAFELTQLLGFATLHAGAWLNTADHTRLDDFGNGKENNSGLYLSIDSRIKSINFNLRLGQADEDISETALFWGLAGEISITNSKLGLGYTHSKLSNQAVSTSRNDSSQLEIYYALDITKDLIMTPSLQILKNTAFDSSSTVYDSNIKIITLRASYLF
jgi:hypothetical protein